MQWHSLRNYAACLTAAARTTACISTAAINSAPRARFCIFGSHLRYGFRSVCLFCQKRNSATSGDTNPFAVRRPPAPASHLPPFIEKTFWARPITPVSSHSSAHPYDKAVAHPDRFSSDLEHPIYPLLALPLAIDTVCPGITVRWRSENQVEGLVCKRQLLSICYKKHPYSFD